jgi:hypothetical protein
MFVLRDQGSLVDVSESLELDGLGFNPRVTRIFIFFTTFKTGPTDSSLQKAQELYIHVTMHSNRFLIK